MSRSREVTQISLCRIPYTRLWGSFPTNFHCFTWLYRVYTQYYIFVKNFCISLLQYSYTYIHITYLWIIYICIYTIYIYLYISLQIFISIWYLKGHVLFSDISANVAEKGRRGGGQIFAHKTTNCEPSLKYSLT